MDISKIPAPYMHLRSMLSYILFLLISIVGNTQTLTDYYDLTFNAYNECNWDWLILKKNCKITKIHKDDTNILLFNYENKLGVNNQAMEFEIGKSIILPKTNDNNLTISLKAKNDSENELFFIVVGIDNSEKILFKKIETLKKTSSWEKIVLTNTLKKVSAINLYFTYKGKAKENQSIGLQDLSINVNEKDISTYNDDVNNDKVKLNSSSVIPLNMEDEEKLLGNIKKIRNKRIIGLGESIHGNEAIANAQYFFLRSLIKQDNCKLVILEMPFDFAMLIDLFVQGLASESSERLVKDYLKLGMDVSPLYNFLNWTRRYNTSAKEKVHVIGIDNSGFIGNIPLPLMDYHLELLGKDNAQIYLQKLSTNQIHNLIDIAEKDSIIKSVLGNKNFSYYKYVLQDEYSKNKEERYLDRDSKMMKRFIFIETLFTNSKQKIAILSHSSHLQKTKHVSDQYHIPLGYLLSKKYGKSYFALNFSFGSGKFTQDSCYSSLRLIEDSLKFIPKNSFENAALKVNHNFFFYPSKQISDDIITTVDVRRNSQNKNHFKFANLKNRFDGYIFIRESKPFENIEKKPFSYSFKFFANKRRMYKKLLVSKKEGLK